MINRLDKALAKYKSKVLRMFHDKSKIKTTGNTTTEPGSKPISPRRQQNERSRMLGIHMLSKTEDKFTPAISW
jgi:hypothetical protein